MAQDTGGGDAAAVDISQILEQLKQLKEERQSKLQTEKGQMLSTLKSAAQSPSSAGQFYLKAIEEGDFAGNRSGYRAWAEKNEAKVKDKAFQYATQKHLTYLALTLDRGTGAETKDLLPALLEYTKDFFNPEMQEALRVREMMGEDLGKSIFTKRYNLAGYIGGLKDWEMQPGNVMGIYTKTILPVYRETKDVRAIQFWDARFQYEAALAKEAKNEAVQTRFETIRRPQLEWSRASEYQNIGQTNRAIGEMFAIIKKYPFHPDFDKWVSALEKVLKPAA